MVRKLLLISALAIALVTLYGGCADNKPEMPSAAPLVQVMAGEDHTHKPSAHSGLIVPIGRNNYHAEAVFEKEGVLRLYTLGADEAKVLEVESQLLQIYVKPDGDMEPTSVLLTPSPQPGDNPGKTSLFLGKLPKALWGKPLTVTVPITIAGERFRFSFASANSGHADEPPSPVEKDAEAHLYLTPGGKYTPADIEANGRQTATQKFEGFRASHDLKPRPGDKICPVTLTKANPQCTWVIGGKTYEFCCPPCVEEFLTLAKENPDEIKDPEKYVKKQ